MKTAKQSVAAALLVFLAACSQQTLRIPDTTAGKAMSDFLAAYNSAELERVTTFFERHGSGDRSFERATWVLGFVYPGVRRFVPQDVVTSTPDAITLRGRSALTEAQYRFTIEVDAQPPHGVSFGFVNDDTPSEWAGRSDDAASYLERLADEDFFSGAAMVADDQRVVHSGAYGDVMDLATQINIGSANKMFTAVAVMTLVEQGKLRLDATIGRYLHDYPNADAKSQVTIHHLLTHTSGIGDYFNEKYFARQKEIRTVAELLPFFALEPLHFRPGEKWEYSNGGYAVLGYLIERVSGLSYEAYVQRHVFASAGMQRTSGDPREPVARGHTFYRPGGRIALTREANDFALPAIGSPAGGGYSTVEDLVAFARALRAGKLVSTQSLGLMLTPRVLTDRGTQYGYGFEITTRDGQTVFGHNGHHLGISAQLDVYPQSGTIVAVLSNYDPPTAPVVATRLGRLASF